MYRRKPKIESVGENSNEMKSKERKLKWQWQRNGEMASWRKKRKASKAKGEEIMKAVGKAAAAWREMWRNDAALFCMFRRCRVIMLRASDGDDAAYRAAR